DFAVERLLRGFSFFDLSAGKLPFMVECSTAAALCAENPTVANNGGSYHVDDLRFVGASCFAHVSSLHTLFCCFQGTRSMREAGFVERRARRISTGEESG